MNQVEIDARIRAWAVRRRLTESHLERWLSQAAETRKILLDLSENFSLRTGQFVTIYDLLDEISLREKMGVVEVLALPTLARILSGEGSGPGRAAQLIAALRAIRYPRLHRAQAAASARVKALHLPRNIRVSWPSDMDGELKIELIAHGAEQMAVVLDAIATHRAALCALADEIG